MKKYLFLDHDGVICLEEEWGSRFTGEANGIFDRFNPQAVEVLNRIVDKTGCQIVVSSDWRHHCELPQMCEVYTRSGINTHPIGYTPGGKMSIRGLELGRAKEIEKWLEEQEKPFSWCAIDDMDMREYLGDHFVWCTSREGLAEIGLAEKIIHILNTDPATRGAILGHEGEE